MSLLSLPTRVFCEVTRHMHVKDLVRLDSAFCHHHHRFIWLELVRSKQFTVHSAINISNNKLLSWLIKLKIKASSVQFIDEQASFGRTSQYLLLTGSSIHTALFANGNKSYEMVLVALYCKHWTKIYMQKLTLTSAFTDILLSNPHIHDISCENVTSSEDNIMVNVRLNKLTTMWVSDSIYHGIGSMWHETTTSDSLHTVIWENSFCYSKDREALFANCPRLRSYRANHNTGWWFASWSSIARLINLSCSQTRLRNPDVLAIVQFLVHLRTFDITQCPKLTDESLRYAAEFAGQRLEVLHTDLQHPERAQTEAILEVFGQKCIKLAYLNINCGEKLLCAGRGTSLIVGGCPALRTLVVNKHSTIGPSSRGFIAQLRPELQRWVHDDSTAYNIFAMPVD